jgi:hypothetical protein
LLCHKALWRMIRALRQGSKFQAPKIEILEPLLTLGATALSGKINSDEAELPIRAFPPSGGSRG